MVFCSISSCGNSSTKCNFVNKGITFHKFPKDPDIKDKWISATGKRNWFPTNYSRICSVHFKNEQFNSSTKRQNLIKSAVPTVDVWKLITLTDPHEGDSSSGTNESKAKGRASTCKTTRLIPLLKSAEDIIVNVYNYLQVEYDQLKSSIGTSCDLSPLANILQRTAAATGVSEQAVSAILLEKERAADEELLIDASDAKRAKLTHDYGDGDVSPITDESSCEAPNEEQDDITEQDNDNEQGNVQTCDERQEPVETLNVLIKEEEDDGPSDPLQLHMSDDSDTTASDVKLEPPS